MKKVILSGVAMIALATATLFTTSSCKKEEVVPTVAGVNFDTEVTAKTVYLSSSTASSATVVGSFFSLSTGSAGISCSSNATVTGSFQLYDASGTVKLVNDYNSGSGCYTRDATLPEACTFATTTLVYATATAEQVNGLTIDANEVGGIDTGTTIAIKTKSGKKGLLNITSINSTDKFITFSYKLIK